MSFFQQMKDKYPQICQKEYVYEHFLCTLLLKTIPYISYETALKKQKELRPLGFLYARNRYGLITIKKLLDYYLDDNNEIVALNYIFPSNFANPFRLEYLNKKTKVRYIKQFRHYKDPELRYYLDRFKHFNKCAGLMDRMFIGQKVAYYEKLYEILESD